MPGLDKSGPMGKGARTGRKMGRCNSNNDAGSEDFPRGRRLGRGLGKRLRLKRSWNSLGDGN